MRVYLDYAATSPVKEEVLRSMLPYLKNDFGNPSSLHQWGQIARQAVDEARGIIADFLNASPSEIVFTSGGTEADNLALRGIVTSLPKQPVHIITSQIEHHAILKTCEALEYEGLAEVTYLKPNRAGICEVEQVKKAIKVNTVLVSIMYVNNEIGTVQPIREIGKMIEKENRHRLEENRRQLGKRKTENGLKSNFQSPISQPISNFHQPFSMIYFHTDAVQATEYQPMDVDYLHVDLLTISGHKIGAPKGIGCLYIRKGTPSRKIIFGGEQEMNLRAGTENVAGIVALGKAITLCTKYEVLSTPLGIQMKKLRDYFIKKILTEIPEVELNGSKEERNPNNANFYFRYIEGESILLNLDLVGIAASSGSACTSQSLQPSHVLLAVYNKPERAHGSIRFTLGEATTQKEIDYVVQKLKIIVAKLRAMSPLYHRKGKNG